MELCADFSHDEIEFIDYASGFSDFEFDDIEDALAAHWNSQDDDLLPQGVRKLDGATLFICDPSNLVQITNANSSSVWYDPDSRESFEITSESEICPAGLKTRFASHPGPPLYYVIILCPPSTTRIPGQPRMFPTLRGGDLESELSSTTPVTTEMTMNLQFWTGMHIDQLRLRTLSVLVGRYCLYITHRKYATRLGHLAGRKPCFTFNDISRILHYR